MSQKATVPKARRNGSNGSNGHVKSTARAIFKLPTIDELKRAYDEGLELTLSSGTKVVMRPIKPDALLLSGKVPDILTPMIMNMLFPKKEDDTVFPDEVKSPVFLYLTKQREEAQEAMEFIKSIDIVCEAALVDPSILPYLEWGDRANIFQLAFMPVAVLSTFRHQPQTNVETGDDSAGEPQQAEPVVTVDSGAK